MKTGELLQIIIIFSPVLLILYYLIKDMKKKPEGKWIDGFQTKSGVMLQYYVINGVIHDIRSSNLEEVREALKKDINDPVVGESSKLILQMVEHKIKVLEEKKAQ